jgi:lipoprotein signal peptidase
MTDGVTPGTPRSRSSTARTGAVLICSSPMTAVLCGSSLTFLSLRPGADRLAWLPAGLLVGGALGNLADRVRDEAVTDWIDFPAWPTFNLADVAIVVGVISLVLLPEFRARTEQDDDP